jgi:acetamidase/formamidase
LRETTADPARVHHEWDLELEPSLEIEPGDVVHFELAMAGRGQVELGATVEQTSFDFATLYNLLGPVYVAGAQPGDVLEIEVLSLEPGNWGWTAILPEFGLLPEDFPEPYLRTFDLEGRNRAELSDGISIPLQPFLGTMGVHPGEPSVASPFPPHRGGGNIDTRHLVTGSTLWLPVWCDGALFSCGDPHAVQGDGEVCVSAIECDMRATLRFGLRRDVRGVPGFSVPAGVASGDLAGYIGTMGIGPDLMAGARQAVRLMIDRLEHEHGLRPEDAYILCSLAGDLRIFEIVDAGVWNVGITLPRGVFA